MRLPRRLARSVSMSICARTDRGQRRSENQDRYLVVDLAAPFEDGALIEGGEGMADASEAVTIEQGAAGALFVVADGMGGAAAGGIASSMATQAIHGAFSTTPEVEIPADATRFADHLATAVEQASRAIHARAHEEMALRGMGTTATAAGLLEDSLFIAQVGDSRAYLIRRGRCVQITRDQSVVQTMMEAGHLTPEQAEQSPHGNLILQALGTHPDLEVELTRQEVRRKDTLLLCSDGLSGVVRAHEMAEIVDDSTDLAEACGRLVDLANERGGPDNITALLVAFDGPGLATPGRGDFVGRRVWPRSGEG